MSFRRQQVTRKDASHESVVEALRAAGVEVIPIGRPVDLLLYTRSGWSLMEVKREGYKRPRKDQQKQTEFIAKHGIPVVRTPVEALAALGLTTDELP